MTNIQRLGLLLTGILMLTAGMAMWKCQRAGVAECESVKCDSMEVAGCEVAGCEVTECDSVGVTESVSIGGARDFLNEVISDD